MSKFSLCKIATITFKKTEYEKLLKDMLTPASWLAHRLKEQVKQAEEQT